VNHHQIKEVIHDTLVGLGDKYADPRAVTLVYHTGYIESRYEYIKQLGSGPARSFWQVEPGMTGAMDNVVNYLKYRPKLAAKCAEVTGTHTDVWLKGNEAEWDKILMVNISAGVVHCRLKYWRSPIPLPQNLEGEARIWKTAYNTDLGDGTIEKYIDIVSSLT